MNQKIAIAFRDELEKISNGQIFKPTGRPKKLDPQEAFYAARRQPPAEQRVKEKKKIFARKKKFGRLFI